uniref:Putative RNA-dependent RNA polymerase n=1 Tax=Barns Ness dog whelk narna-like virus 1 TaxID=2021955 RepID=A0A221LFN2_9VIRU|nr:putative RNA-dependent RNA polymerase [Barns Ness dog whelk narna-like virus 1]
MNRATMCGRLMSLGIPKMSAVAIIQQIKTWEDNCGSEWTVSRLKEIKQLFVKGRAGEDFRPKMYIRTNKEGYPSGPISYLFRKYSQRKLSKLLTALMGYSAYKSVHFTEQQKEKFFSALESPDTRGLASHLRHLPNRLENFVRPIDPLSLPEYCVRDTRAPGESGMVSERDYVSVAIHAAMSNPIRMMVARYEDIFKWVIPIDEFFDIQPPPATQSHRHTLGIISGIQEHGFKLRAIANPSRVLQCALEPLKNALEATLRRVPNDGTFDQTKAIPIVQGWLQERSIVHSIDLSDATTMFPWNVTKDFLERSHPHFKDYISLMDECATGPWACSIREPNEVVHFSRGQPLGLGPSFFAFALTHHAILDGLCEKHKLSRKNYFILGDDVVIKGNRLANLYRKTMSNLGCSFSDSKSITSNKVAEFAGFVITSDQAGKGMKWKEISDHSVLEHVKFLGRKSLGYLTAAQRALVKLVAPVPTDLGGLGWSDGRSSSEYFDTPGGKAVIDQIANRLEDNLTRDVPQENLEYHLRRLNACLRWKGNTEAKDRFIGQYLRVSDWKQSVSSEYKLGKGGLSSPQDPRSPYRILGPLRKGYFPLVKSGGDPRPTILSYALVIYQAHLSSGSKRDKLIERTFENYFRRPFSQIIFTLNSQMEMRLASKQQLRKKTIDKGPSRQEPSTSHIPQPPSKKKGSKDKGYGMGF